MCRYDQNCECGSGAWGDPIIPIPWGPVMETEKPPAADVKMSPRKCVRCDFINEYVGPEHLDANGIYKCRSCKQNPYR